MARQAVTAEDVRAVPAGGELVVPAGAVLTDLAREEAQRRKVTIRFADSPAPETPAAARVVALGADHAGYELKQYLKRHLEEWGYEVRDLGTQSTEPVDYPDFAAAVARAVAGGAVWRGIVVDGAGIGSAMAANKVAGARAALCYDRASARNSREHNDANVLTLGARMLSPEQAREIVAVWLETPFGGGRHQRRVEKISALERRDEGKPR